MTIKLGSYVLCAGDTRNSAGDPVGPQNLRLQETPGVAVREFVGADRVKPEHVRSDSGSVTFGVTRTFASAADALVRMEDDLVMPNRQIITLYQGRYNVWHSLYPAIKDFYQQIL